MRFARDEWARPTKLSVLLAGLLLVGGCRSDPPKTAKRAHVAQDTSPVSQLRAAPGTLAELLAYEDTDGDGRITVLDEGAGWFDVPLSSGGSYRARGTYHLANLVQELVRAHHDGRDVIPLQHVEEPVPERISRLIRDYYWAGLTRQIGDHAERPLEDVLADPKTDLARRSADTEDAWPDDCTPRPSGVLPQFLYVPRADAAAFAHYKSLIDDHPALVVCRTPQVITPAWVHALSATATRGSRHGLLSLALRQGAEGAERLEPVPYVVPGGRFNELYGWDSYFHVIGLLADGKTQLARHVVDNQLYELRHYGKVLNANRTYYLTRSQPPFLSSSVRALWDAGVVKDSGWLKAALGDLVNEYESVWNADERLTPLCQAVPSGGNVCLATYHADGLGEPPEVEPGHFDWLYEPLAQKHQQTSEAYRELYRQRQLPRDELAELDWFFMHDGSMRESGHDTTYRWFTEEGDRCADFATIDLNALLFKVELDLAQLTRASGNANFHKWCERASARRDLVQKYLYDGELFVDYHLERDEQRRFSPRGSRSSYVSATTLYPLWASATSPCVDEKGAALELVTSAEQVQRLVTAALTQLEAPGGLAATSRASVERAPRPLPRQWDYPFGWAPHQILAWEGLRRKGYTTQANRLAYRWLYMISKNAHDYHGVVPEKFDVVRRSHEVFAEYGNVGSEFRYITREGFGWMNASFQLGRQQLPAELWEKLRRLVPPEDVAEVQ